VPKNVNTTDLCDVLSYTFELGDENWFSKKKEKGGKDGKGGKDNKKRDGENVE
jgi:hypothetical protein